VAAIPPPPASPSVHRLGDLQQVHGGKEIEGLGNGQIDDNGKLCHPYHREIAGRGAVDENALRLAASETADVMLARGHRDQRLLLPHQPFVGAQHRKSVLDGGGREGCTVLLEE
jgi:hypothetical protein